VSKSTKNKLMRKLAHVKVLKAIKKQAGSVLYMPHGASIGALSSDKGSRLPGAVAGALAAPIGVSGGAALGGLLFDKGLAGRTGAGIAGGAMAAYLAARA